MITAGQLSGDISKNGVPLGDPRPHRVDAVHCGAGQRPLLLASHSYDHRLLLAHGSSHCHILTGELPLTGTFTIVYTMGSHCHHHHHNHHQDHHCHQDHHDHLDQSSDRASKVQLHWIFNLFSIIAAAGGFGAIYLNKEVIGISFYHFFHCHFIEHHCRHDHDHNHRHHGLGSGQIPLHKLARKIWSRRLCWLRPGCRWRDCSKIQVKLLTWRDFIFCLILTWRGLIFCLLQFQSEKLCEADKCEALPRYWSSCW